MFPRRFAVRKLNFLGTFKVKKYLSTKQISQSHGPKISFCFVLLIKNLIIEAIGKIFQLKRLFLKLDIQYLKFSMSLNKLMKIFLFHTLVKYPFGYKWTLVHEPIKRFLIRIFSSLSHLFFVKHNSLQI